MSIFSTGEEVICINANEHPSGKLVQGKTYIVLGQGLFCNCCIDVGVEWCCSETRFRRPSHDSITTETKVPECV